MSESLRTLRADFPLIKTACPNWDNDARRQTRSLSLAHSTPKAFEDWLRALLSNARDNRFHDEAYVFVNAWNEWCEGAYLEPDTHFGFAYLNAVGRAAVAVAGEASRIVLVGHDAFPAGAQHLLLNLGKLLRRQFGMAVRFVLLGGGRMAGAYRDVAETWVATEAKGDGLEAHLASLRRQGFRHAICNTVASGGATILLDDLKFSFCTLVHELPTVVRSGNFEKPYAEIRARGAAAVYPNAYVKAQLDAEFGEARIPAAIVPQGLYNEPHPPPEARRRLREALGLGEEAEIVLNVGYADLRKGVDIFLDLAEQVARLRPGVVFLWLGDAHPYLEPWLAFDIARRSLSHVRFVSFQEDVGLYFSGADLFLSTSREDPFPSVVLEALSVGLPVVAIADSGGHAALIADDPRLGALIPYAEPAVGAETIVQRLAASARPDDDAAWRRALVAARFDFAAYGAELMRRIDPRYASVSVVVPNYNYALYLRERLLSIFAQTYPVYETIVLDDASEDESLDVVRDVSNEAARRVAVRRRTRNSGNPFRQWKSGLDEIRGEFVWIAEADDSADPRFVAEAVERLRSNPDAAFCFCDSRSIDADSAALSDSYKSYYREFGDHGLDRDGTFSGDDFLRRFLCVRNMIVNASAIVWRTASLRAVFEQLGDEAFALRCAGDWRIYVEACRLGMDIVYISETLNAHRRHGASVTGRLDRKAHLREVERVQTIALEAAKADDALRRQAAAWRADIARIWKVRKT